MYNGHMEQSLYPKIGIALGAGGAKGLAHIGVLKVLESEGIKIDFVAGSSIGALIGAYYAAHPALDKLEDLILTFNKRKGFMLFDPVLRGGLLRGDKIEQFISDMLEGAEFKSLRIPYTAIATDFITGKEVSLDHGDLVKAVRASISVPAIFRPVKYGKMFLADGALADPVPTTPVREMGADLVIAVNVESNYFTTPRATIPSLSQAPLHSIIILQHNLTLHSLKTSDVAITPDIEPIGLVGWNYLFDSSKAQVIIKAGEDAARKALPEIRKAIEEKRNEKEKYEKKHPGFFKRIFTFFKK